MAPPRIELARQRAEHAPLRWPWGAAVWGDVLEVGLGAGVLAHEIADNPKVTSHTIIERDGSLRVLAPAGSRFVCAEFPTGLGSEKFDCITLDYPRYDLAHHKCCLAHLNEGGALFIRCIAI